jgi:hypothetical protein
MISACVSASSIASPMSVPASLALCCLGGSHAIAERLVPMYIAGQVCSNRTGGGVWCFSEKSNNELPAFSLVQTLHSSKLTTSKSQSASQPRWMRGRSRISKRRCDLRRCAEDIGGRLTDHGDPSVSATPFKHKFDVSGRASFAPLPWRGGRPGL